MLVLSETTFEGTAVDPGLPGTLLSGQLGAGVAVFTVDGALTGMTVSSTTTVEWSDAAGNAYGPLDFERDTFVDLPAALTVTLADSRVIDADSNGLTGAGDTLGYDLLTCMGSSGHGMPATRERGRESSPSIAPRR